MLSIRLPHSLAYVVAILPGILAGVTVAEQKPILETKPATSNPLDQDFSEFVKSTLESWKVPGLSIAVIDDQKIFAEGYGFATLPDKPATPETIWYGASTTKAYVAAALASIIDGQNYSQLSQGWSTPISSLIRDDFVLQNEWSTAHVTLEDAASHRTGIGSLDMAALKEENGVQETPKVIVRKLRHLPLFGEPRTKWVYSNAMYITLGHVLETLTGKWLGNVLKDIIWSPLGMKSTYFDLEDAVNAPEHLASGYEWDPHQNNYTEVPYIGVTQAGGSGAIFSNVLDYAKWVQSLLHETGPLSKAVHKDIKTPRMIADPLPSGGFDAVLYGLGWERTFLYNQLVYKHSGGMHAYGAYVYWLPQLQYGVVAFGNTAVTSNHVQNILITKLIADKLGIPQKERFDFEASAREGLDKQANWMKHALDNLYPDRPSAPLPATVDTSQLVGAYYHPGFGPIRLREEPDPNDSKRTVLKSDREEAEFSHGFTFQHVSGDHWIIYADMYTAIMNTAFRSEFQIGVDGKPSGLKIEFPNRGAGVAPAVPLFERM
ncbi:hypothetical protein QQS21_008872 [Conoideocrella luteorostrata]|uniref:Beta-lactamase-related domain-containing protein n=1 Tax=Conoideocrella luteorostrata TaxID=1105319 RepID=A0AAJ0CMF6_9HYPO|nr:hypothetical protein QQS21_008872 [Conoideocrella luteorostrata]